jgi:hypothetical protein
VEVETPETWHGPGLGRHAFVSWAVQFGGFTTAQVADALGHRLPGVAMPLYIHAQVVEPVRRPMSLKVKAVLLKALGNGGTKRRKVGGMSSKSLGRVGIEPTTFGLEALRPSENGRFRQTRARDDLVLAVALACWLGENEPRCWIVVG